jgi:type IV secretion system protein VirB1
VFEPCANLRAASRVLEDCYERALQRWDDAGRAVSAALSCYNTGDFTRGTRNGYVSAVRAAASSAAPQSTATDSAQSQPARRPGAQRSARWPAVERRTADAPARDEVFAVAMADVFDADSREERAR